ncbi:MAG: AAA family ATPase [Acidimicrobiales bacterium]
MVCANCATESPPSAKFCLECGVRLHVRTCGACGGRIPVRAKFCPECGNDVRSDAVPEIFVRPIAPASTDAAEATAADEATGADASEPSTATAAEADQLPGVAASTSTRAGDGVLRAGENENKAEPRPVPVEPAPVEPAVPETPRSPFINRDHELRMLQGVFGSVVADSRAHLVVITGPAGSGKSRLISEFGSWLDDRPGDVWWHLGRCPTRGTGVAYRALAEIVSVRLKINNTDTPQAAALHLTAALDELMARSPDPSAGPADRALITAALAQLVGIPVSQPLDREGLFVGLRLFFEQLASVHPVVVVIDDMGRTDPGLVAWLRYLLDWSSGCPILVVLLARDEAAASLGLERPSRRTTVLPLEPLGGRAMTSLVEGFAGGFAADQMAEVVERADGLPLYAVEIVRLLTQRGVIATDDHGVPRFSGSELDAPPNLEALITLRLKSLPAEERRVLGACSVLAPTWSVDAAAAMTGRTVESIRPLLRRLVDRDVLAVCPDRFSADRGRFQFNESLTAELAYRMLGRDERKQRHVAAAVYLQSAFPDHGARVAHVIAWHFLAGLAAGRGDADESELRSAARDALIHAAERAASIGASLAADEAYRVAAGLTSSEPDRLRIEETAATMAWHGGELHAAAHRLEELIGTYESSGAVLDVARAVVMLAGVLESIGHPERAISKLRQSIEAIDSLAIDDIELFEKVRADLLAHLARALLAAGDLDEARIAAGEAVVLARRREAGGALAVALATEGYLHALGGRIADARWAYSEALETARANRLLREESVVLGGLCDAETSFDMPEAREHLGEALELDRRRCDRLHESVDFGRLMLLAIFHGSFDRAEAFAREALGGGTPAEGAGHEGTGDTADVGDDERPGAGLLHCRLALLEALRGRSELARAHLERCRSWPTSSDPLERTIYAAADGWVKLAMGDIAQAMASAQLPLEELRRGAVPSTHESIRVSLPCLVDAALALKTPAAAEPLLSWVATLPGPPRAPFLAAQMMRGEALLAAARGRREGVLERLSEAERICRRLSYRYWIARVQLDHAEFLLIDGRRWQAAPLARAAVSTFDQLSAKPIAARARDALRACARPG